MNARTVFTVGREALRPFIVAVKRGARWPDEFEPALERARADYCSGTHEMCQGREGPTIIQYSIPRKAPVAPRPFPVARAVEGV